MTATIRWSSGSKSHVAESETRRGPCATSSLCGLSLGSGKRRATASGGACRQTESEGDAERGSPGHGQGSRGLSSSLCARSVLEQVAELEHPAGPELVQDHFGLVDEGHVSAFEPKA